MFLSAYISFW